jgi:hypothetical protein
MSITACSLDGVYPKELEIPFKQQGMPLEQLPTLELREGECKKKQRFDFFLSRKIKESSSLSSIQKVRYEFMYPGLAVWIENRNDKTQQAVVTIFQRFNKEAWQYQSEEDLRIGKCYAKWHDAQKGSHQGEFWNCSACPSYRPEGIFNWLIKLLKDEDPVFKLAGKTVKDAEKSPAKIPVPDKPVLAAPPPRLIIPETRSLAVEPPTDRKPQISAALSPPLKQAWLQKMSVWLAERWKSFCSAVNSFFCFCNKKRNL